MPLEKALKSLDAEITLIDDVGNKKIVKLDSLEFSNEEDTILNLNIPAKCQNLIVSITYTLHDNQKVVKTKTISCHSQSSRLMNGFFRKIGDDYFFYLLGRDGEPKTLQKVLVEI